MQLPPRLARVLRWLSPRLVDWLFRQGQRLPGVRARLEKEYAGMLGEAGAGARPYQQDFAVVTELPQTGQPRAQVLATMEALAAKERPRWESGHASGSVYHGDPAHIEFLNRVYALHSQSNPLHGDLWPSIGKFEAEIVAMTAAMLNGQDGKEPGKDQGDEQRVSGTVTSGGTESIVLAMKAYRDHGRRVRGIARPEIVVPASAHAAFDKAEEILGLRVIKVPVGADLRADVNAMARAVSRRTVALVGSAPSFPHGLIDDIPQLARVAEARGVGLHVDACLGGFVLPFAERLLGPTRVPPFDFRLPAVTSMSADPHKYGYAAKGVSVVLYRGAELRRQQYFVNTDWSGGLYFSPTFAGSRPGGLSAACWAAMVAIGQDGYLDATNRILTAAGEARAAVEAIPGLRVLGDPLWVIAFASAAEDVDIYRVLDLMNDRGWSLNGLQRPAAVHLCVTLRHAEPGVIARFAADLRACVQEVKSTPAKGTGMAPVYGMAGSFPVRGAVAELLRRYVDRLYDP